MQAGLQKADLQSDPFLQFEQWFNVAIQSDLPEPNAMCLATVDGEGQPWQRMVLLKTFDRKGFVFFTNYESRKAHQIKDNNRVSILFPWHAMARQVKITGLAEKVSTAESLRYFLTRPRGSQLGAWASPQSKIITSRSLLDIKFNEIKEKFSHGEVPLPDYWGGYRISPTTFEFWQARESRLHDRFIYVSNDPQTWTIERLAP
jgi:pyridoxamine 5'-phosphate oxidase